MPTPSSTATPRIPTATYRVQLHKDFTFNQAREIVPYLAALGISDLYTSPFFQASPGSTHGYDIVDHNHLNPEVGTPEDFAALVAELKKHGMGLLTDFVPNHMGIGVVTNQWWMDVLENGPSSLAAPCFDIDWHPLKRELENKVLLPILGDQYGRVLERGELTLEFEHGAFFLRYFENRLPINPRSYNQVLQRVLEELKGPDAPVMLDLGTANLPDHVRAFVRLQSIMTQLENMPARTITDPAQIVERAREKEVAKERLRELCAERAEVTAAVTRVLNAFQGQPGEPRSFDRLDQLVEAQSYRLSYWRVAAEEINYRRFFDINQLAAIRVELPAVFDAVHKFLFSLIADEKVTGLRIDHPDGLYDPRRYFAEVQEHCARVRRQTLPDDGRGIYLLAEKILSGDEQLREDWPIHGTTGYDFTTHVTQLLVNSEAEQSFSETYQRFIGRNVHFPTLTYEKKRLVMRLSLANDVNVLASIVNRLSERNRLYRDFTLNALTTAVREVIACFPVYRTYLEHGHAPQAEDRAVVNRAVALAKRQNPGIEASIFDFLRDILLFRFPADLDAEGIKEHEHFVMKFQQTTGPIMAKGLEDTAFYIFNRLAALNEVGGEPEHFGITPAEFHATCTHNARRWPHTMLATSTHDTKRAEDTRARVLALSEMPDAWRESLRTWSKLNAAHKATIEGETAQAPDPNEEYLLYQILLGTWPVGAKGKDPAPTSDAVTTHSLFGVLSGQEHAEYIARIQDYMTKAIKEAKVNSSWVQPNEAWDEGVRKFIAALLRRGDNPFVEAFEPLAETVARLGAMNSLAQTVLKLTVPGVPDIYQGCDTWDFSLVDPDNRRPVDYAQRREALDALAGSPPGDLLAHWPDGRVKLFVTRTLLRYRREHAELFAQGSYRTLKVAGRHAESVVAFEREHEDRSVVVIVPRVTSRLGAGFPVGASWENTTVTLAAENPAPLHELFTGRTVSPNERGVVALADMLADFPLAVLGR